MKNQECDKGCFCFFRTTLIAFFFLCPGVLFSQTDTVARHFSFTGYIEGYYSYDFADPSDKLKPPYFYSFNRHNEPNINLAMLKASYLTNKFRANAALMAGTYSQYNLAAEPELLRYLYELNVGVKLSRKDLWLDAGVMSSHIGFESAIGKDCWSLTRSIMAENSPYYETGVKLGYGSDNGKWYAAILFLAGWQRMKPVEGNSLPSFGTQLQYRPTDKIVFNSSSFIGTDKPDSARKMRYFHDLYGIFKLNAKLSLQAAFDVGAEQKEKNSSSYNFWYTWVAGMSYSWNRRLTSGLRLEYYQDKNAVIISTETGAPMAVYGASLNFDITVLKNLLWRIEGRLLNGKDDVFLEDGRAVNAN
ncbi:MAG TPA: porin, partial [Chitinophagaceae bacterium]|nr:porin [Chitinophagaceae bacterium]